MTVLVSRRPMFPNVHHFPPCADNPESIPCSNWQRSWELYRHRAYQLRCEVLEVPDPLGLGDMVLTVKRIRLRAGNRSLRSSLHAISYSFGLAIAPPTFSPFLNMVSGPWISGTYSICQSLRFLGDGIEITLPEECISFFHRPHNSSKYIYIRSNHLCHGHFIAFWHIVSSGCSLLEAQSYAVPVLDMASRALEWQHFLTSMVLNICHEKLSMREPAATIQGSMQIVAASALIALEDPSSKVYRQLLLLDSLGGMYLQIFAWQCE